MAEILRGRMTAEIEGEFVVFLIGMRINKPLAVASWLPAFRAMPPMLRELATRPELGCLASEGGFPLIVQYWRSFEHLERYARSRDHAHLPAWQAFNRTVRTSNGAVGIWHETYRVAPGSYETLYGDMPAFGLGRAGRLVPAGKGRASARERMHGTPVEATEVVTRN